MISYHHAYLFGSLVCLLIWAVLFASRKDLRREMLIMSLLFTIFSAAEYFWTIDWWRPETITGTRIGIEDFILGFATGGIAAVLYEEVMRRRSYRAFGNKHTWQFIALSALGPIVTATTFRYFHVTTFIATIIASIIVGMIIMSVRPDLLNQAIISGLLVMLVSMAIYQCIILFSPGFIERTWLLDSLSGLTLLHIPIEDLTLYFFVGFITAPLYEYWQGLRLRKL